MILVGEKNIGSLSVEIANKAGIKALLFGALTLPEQEKIGSPREKLLHWIGQMQIDDFTAGYQVAKSIIDQAIQANLYHSDGKLYILALAGVFETSFNEERVRGLRAALEEYKDVVLLQVVPAYWQIDKAEAVTEGLLYRYQTGQEIPIAAIWSANTAMALGAIQGARKYNLVPGKDIFVSGIDYMADGIRKVQSGEMVSVVGGFFADIAWLLVMAHDHHLGRDFIGEPDKTEIFSLGKHNADLFMANFAEKNWDKIDFTQFSRVLNPQVQHYDFSFKAILEQLEVDEKKTVLPQ